VVVWNETFTKHGRLLELGKVVAMTAKVDKREEAVRLSAAEIRAIQPSGGRMETGMVGMVEMVLGLRRSRRSRCCCGFSIRKPRRGSSSSCGRRWRTIRGRGLCMWNS